MADDTTTKVLQAAGPIFADRGYEAATVREICAAAGVNLASVNYHFGGKETLYLETVRLAHTLRLEHVPAPTWAPGTAADEKLAMFIRAMLERMLATGEQAWQTRLLMREMLQPTIACRAIVEDFIRPQLDLLLGILDELLPPEASEHCRYKTAFSIVGQCAHYRVAGEFVGLLIPQSERAAHYQIGQLADHITRFSLAALTELRHQQPAGQIATENNTNRTF